MTAKSHPAAMRFIPDQSAKTDAGDNNVSSPELESEPARYGYQ